MWQLHCIALKYKTSTVFPIGFGTGILSGSTVVTDPML